MLWRVPCLVPRCLKGRTGVAQRRNTSAAMKAGVPDDSHDFVAERLSCALPHFSYQMLHHSIQRLHQVLENH